MTPKALLDAIALPASAVSKRSTLHILECLRIADGQATGTDLEREISASVDLDLSCCVSAGRLMAALKALPADCDAKIDMDKDRLRVRGGRSKFMIPTLPVEDFPRMDWTEPGTAIEKPGDVAEAIKTVEPAQAVQDVRFYLIGIGTQSGAVHAADGAWAAMHTCAALPDGIIIPRASVPMLLTALGEETVRYGLGDRGLCLAANGYRMSTKLIDAKYPDMTRHWAPKHSATWEVSRDEFVTAVSAIYAMRDRSFKRRPIAEFVIAGGQMRIALAWAGNGEDAETSIACDGPSFTQAYDLEYMQAAASAMHGDTLALCQPLGENTALYLRGTNEAQRAVVMPARA
jgi:DNA polymerase-3 subunit beta